MKTMRIVFGMGLMLFVASCATMRDMWPGRREAGGEPGVPESAAPPAATSTPIAPGDVRVTVVADDAVPAFRITDAGDEIGVVEGGKSLQWDRPGGVVDLQAVPVGHKGDVVRFIGLFLPGEREIPLGSDDDGTLAFHGGKLIHLSEARRISRLHRRAQRLPIDTAVAYLKERLFAAPAPGRLRSAYADADQQIAMDDGAPVLTWSRFGARGERVIKAEGGRARGHCRTMKHAFADFADASIRLGMTTRVAFRRDARDIEPARAYFRLSRDGAIGSQLESLLVALLACCSSNDA